MLTLDKKLTTPKNYLWAKKINYELKNQLWTKINLTKILTWPKKFSLDENLILEQKFTLDKKQKKSQLKN